MYKKLKKLNVEIVTNAEVTDVIVKEKQVKGLKYKKDNKEIKIEADKIILATGGKSYPLTGSTGKGYEIAKKYGHTVTNLKPGLVPLECKEKELCKEMQWLSLKNI